MTTRLDVERSLPLLRSAAKAAGLSPAGAEPIRFAENDLWRLPGRVVVRISRPGQHTAAAREIAVTRWLSTNGFPAVRPLPIAQPVHIGERAATFWEELPPHRPGTATDLGPLLRRLHALPIPGHLGLGTLDPFIRIAKRLTDARAIHTSDRDFLLTRLSELRDAWTQLPAGRPTCVVHGDAWSGNCAITDDGRAVLLDFERTAGGPPEWDLTSSAVALETAGTMSEQTYNRFCDAYGYDVRQWPGYPTMRGIRELRMTTFAAQAADHDPTALAQAQHRIACLRGDAGPRPWAWTAIG